MKDYAVYNMVVLMKVIYNMDFETFSTMLNTCSPTFVGEAEFHENYIEEKFVLMHNDMFHWLCSLNIDFLQAVFKFAQERHIDQNKTKPLLEIVT